MNRVVLVIVAIICGIIIGFAAAFVVVVLEEMHNSFSTIEKPAIYLYPTENMDVRVHVDADITRSDPPYNQGWSVSATPGGKIDGRYDYLFYDATLTNLDDAFADGGWVVPYGGLKSWCESNLPRLGLNAKEQAQFEEYWLTRLPRSDFYEIRLFSPAYLEKNLRLQIDPEPDSLLRLEFYFKPFQTPISIAEPDLPQTTRTGFTVVEWGGVLG